METKMFLIASSDWVSGCLVPTYRRRPGSVTSTRAEVSRPRESADALPQVVQQLAEGRFLRRRDRFQRIEQEGDGTAAREVLDAEFIQLPGCGCCLEIGFRLPAYLVNVSMHREDECLDVSC
jgi:hypothetical protein